MNPSDAKAHYYLGNLWYDKRQYDEAMACWEESIKINEILSRLIEISPLPITIKETISKKLCSIWRRHLR